MSAAWPAHVAVEEVLLHELAKRRGELVLALDDHGGMRNRQPKRMPEQRRHREPVRDAADHRRLGAGLHVGQKSPVHPDRRHDHEQDRHRAEQRGGPSAGGGQAARPQLHRLALDRGCRRSGHRRGRFHRTAPGRSAARQVRASASGE